jgi:hypothetical protein
MIELRWLLDPDIPEGEPRWTLQYRWRITEQKGFKPGWSDWQDVPYETMKKNDRDTGLA